MEYFLNQYDQIFNCEKDFGTNLFANNGLTVQAYHLKKNAVLMERNDDPVINNNNSHQIVYLVISGQMVFHMGDERVTVDAGNSIAIEMDQNFSAWAAEDSNLFSIHNCVEHNVDTTPQELVTAVRKVELADMYLKGHNYRVGRYATLLMQAIAPEQSTTKFHMVAAYHDVGKVAVPSEILQKPGKLTKEEFDAIKKHPAASYDMLMPFLGEKVASFARWHHEKLDGSGYPDGIAGETIPLQSRVLAVADVFDALTTSRCYRSAFSFEKALSIIKEEVDAGKLDETCYRMLHKLIQNQVIVEGIDNYLDVNHDD